MSEQASTPAEAPSPAPAPVVAPAPAVASPASSNDSIYTADELAAIEAAASGTLKPATEVKKGEYEVAELTASDALVIPPELTAPAAKPAAPEAAKPEDEDADADPLQAIKGIKLKPTSYQDMEVLRLMKPRAGKPGLTAAEAVAKVYGTAAPTAKPEAPATTPAAEAPAAPTADAETTAIQSEIAALEAEVEKASDDMDVGKGVKLARQIAAKERQLERIEAERTAEMKRRLDAQSSR
jgi:hypothetical protein